VSSYLVLCFDVTNNPNKRIEVTVSTQSR